MSENQKVKLYFDTLRPIVVKVCQERGYGPAQIATCLCQGALETGYSVSGSLMANANAMFGIKATPSWVKEAKYGGKVYSSKTKECYDGYTFVTITDQFRAYNSIEDSVRDYFDLMECGRYKESLKAKTVQECITIIKNAGYATDPDYVRKIVSIYNVNKQYIDGPVTYNADINYFSKTAIDSDSIVLHLKSIGVDSSFAYRKKIAIANGINNYIGSANQNLKMVELSKSGKLIKP